jgi:hypothetical protein
MGRRRTRNVNGRVVGIAVAGMMWMMWMRRREVKKKKESLWWLCAEGTGKGCE